MDKWDVFQRFRNKFTTVVRLGKSYLIISLNAFVDDLKLFSRIYKNIDI